LLHGKKAIYIDTEKENRVGEDEMEADRYAGNLLIPQGEYSIFVKADKFFLKHIKAFAKKIGIHPGIVVGRLQHDGYIEYSWHNELKEKM
jgi:hypothetical protein